MGNCLFEDNQNKRAIGYHPLLPFQPYSPRRKLKKCQNLQVEIVTWQNQPLPYLKSLKQTTKSQITVDQSGRFLYNEKLDKSILISANEDPQRPLQNQFNPNFYPRKVFEFNISKSLQGYEIKNSKQPLYELITSERQIFCDDYFFFSGVEYNFVKLIKDTKYVQKHVDKVATLKDHSKIKTANFLKSFQDMPQNQNFNCRICLGQQLSKEDPLICPCDCTGSVQYFHLKCWSHWVFSEEITQSGLYIGNILRPQCEICKKNLLKDKHYRETVAALLSSVAKIKAPFMVLEGFKPQSSSLCTRKMSPKLCYIIISLAQKKRITIGRGEVDIPSGTQFTKSKGNTTLEMRENRIFIEDSVSKRGTYARIEGSIIVKDENPKYVLFKNHLICLKMV